MPLSHQVIETHTMPRRKGAKKKTKDEHRPLLFETPDSPHRTSGAGGGYGHGVLEERMPRQPTEKATFMGEVRVRMLKNILVSSWLIFRGSVLAVRLGSVSSGGSMPTVVLSPCSPVAFSLSLFFSLFFFFFLFLHASSRRTCFVVSWSGYPPSSSAANPMRVQESYRHGQCRACLVR